MPDEMWVAQKDISAYRAVNDAPGTPAFVIQKGEKCTPGETSYGKVDAYTAVTCPSGTGWIIDDRGFTKIQIKK